LKGIKLGRVYRIQESDIKEFLEERMTKSKKKEDTKKVKEKVIKIEKEKGVPQDKHYKIQKGNSDDPNHYYVI